MLGIVEAMAIVVYTPFCAQRLILMRHQKSHEAWGSLACL